MLLLVGESVVLTTSDSILSFTNLFYQILFYFEIPVSSKKFTKFNQSKIYTSEIKIPDKM